MPNKTIWIKNLTVENALGGKGLLIFHNDSQIGKNRIPLFQNHSGYFNTE